MEAEQTNTAPSEAQKRADQRRQHVVAFQEALDGMGASNLNARAAANSLINLMDRNQEQVGVLRRKLRNLRKSFSDLQRAHTLLKHWTDKRKRPRVVCLIGSTRFRTEYEQEILRLSLEGIVVLSVGCFRSIPGAGTIDLDPEQKEALDELHLRKMAMADEVRVINPYGYIGASTAREIGEALQRRKRVTYLDESQPAVVLDSPNAGVFDAQVRIVPIPPAVPRREPETTEAPPPKLGRPPGPPAPSRPPGDHPVG